MASRLSPANDEDLDIVSEINLTPFIDVMLVLLIIFMIAAPLSTVDVPVDLPESQTQPRPPSDQPISVTVKADLSLYVNDKPVTRENLGTAIREAGGTPDTRILLLGDKRIVYGDLLRQFDTLRQAGYLKIALIGLESE